jgi:hypothetical protein
MDWRINQNKFENFKKKSFLGRSIEDKKPKPSSQKNKIELTYSRRNITNK